MSNYFLLELCASNRTSCVRCLRPMAPGSLRARKQGQNYHLRCFRPPLSEPIVISQHIRMHGIERDSDVEKVRRWVDRWNAKFVLKESQLPAECCSKQVETVEPDNKRVLLHIFAFLSLKDIEVAAAPTCKEWFHVTRVDELWKSRYVQEYAPDSTNSDSYRQKFIVMQMNCCWHCKKRVTVDKIRRRCPYYKRPLCKQCSWGRECRTVVVDLYLAEKRIEKSLAKFLQFPSFRDKKKTVSYVHLLSTQILPYAEQRRQQLLALLEAEHSDKVPGELLEQIRNFDLKRLYSELGIFVDKVSRPLSFFCGRDAHAEDLQATLQTVLESLGCR